MTEPVTEPAAIVEDSVDGAVVLDGHVVRVGAPFSLRAGSSTGKGITREAVGSSSQIWVLHNVLCPDECRDVIACTDSGTEETEAGGRSKAPAAKCGAGDGHSSMQQGYSKSAEGNNPVPVPRPVAMAPASSNLRYRNTARVIMRDETLAAQLWERIRPHLAPETLTYHDKGDEETSLGIHTKGHWTAIGLNENFRLCRYGPGGHFAPHCDGVFVRNTEERSLYTMMLYLNGPLDGGSTRFLRAHDLRFDESRGIFCGADGDVEHTVAPVGGLALVFFQRGLLHEGEQLASGFKVILRTEIMFRRDAASAPALTEKQARAAELLQQACALEDAGDYLQAATLYRKAFHLDPELENMT